MPEIVSNQAEVKTFNSQPLPKPIKFSYDFEKLVKGDEIPADEVPDSDDILTYVNTKRNSAARAKAQAEALTAAGIQKPTLEDPDFRLRQMIKILVANNMDEETAEKSARAALGM